jgi:hypothetical protein
MFPHHTLAALNPSVARGTPRHPIQKARRIRRHSKEADDSIQEKSTPGFVALKDPSQKDLCLMSDFGSGAARRLYTRTAT